MDIIVRCTYYEIGNGVTTTRMTSANNEYIRTSATS
jgi:hypothetical protein